MNGDTLASIQKKLFKELDRPRCEHTLGVMYTSAALAMAYGESVADAQLAGLLHDCAKCIPNNKKLKQCRKQRIPVTEAEYRNPSLLHAKLGAYYAKTVYSVKDKNILRAIAHHTTGRPNMTVLEKIVYIADYIEPGRNQAPKLDHIRQLAFEDLDLCMYEILQSTLDYLRKSSGTIDQTTVQAFRYYKMLHENSLEKGE